MWEPGKPGKPGGGGGQNPAGGNGAGGGGKDDPSGGLVASIGTGAVVLAVSLLPAVVLAVTVWVSAWRQGWTPTRVRWLVLHAWTVPGLVWLLGAGPVELSQDAYAMVEAGRTATAWVPLLPWMIPVGMTGGALLWARTWWRLKGGEHRSPRQAAEAERRQWRHGMRRATKETRYPGLVPLTDRRADLVLGRVAVAEDASAQFIPPDRRRMVIPWDAIERGMVLIGEPGAGKTVMLQRVTRAWAEAAWIRHGRDEVNRPLVILVNCKGGTEGPEQADAFASAMLGAGIRPERVGQWPQDVRLDLWTLPPARLTEVLVTMARTDNVYYADVQDELVAMAVQAPCGPPKSGPDFIQRLNPTWLKGQYSPNSSEGDAIKQLGKDFAGISARYRTLFRRIGRAFDSGRDLGDFDAFVATVEGTANAVTAGANVQALVELVTDLAARPAGRMPRKVLLIIDEHSVVADRVPIVDLMERGRSQGVGLIPAVQSWVSLAEDERAVRRLVAAAAGGILAMSTSDPESIAKAAGNRPAVKASIRRTEGGDADGSFGGAEARPLVDPDLLRQAGRTRGAAVYASHGLAVWGIVAPVEVTDAALRIGSNPVAGTIEAYSPAGITRGDRVPLKQIEAALDQLDAQATRSGEDNNGGDDRAQDGF